ncbi:MAG: cytochrome [Thermoleophilia bacterium]|nr:cytochrome [Thermoleophilia bacterium]
MSDHTPAHTNGETPTLPPERFERLHTAERWWLRVGSLMLIAFLTVVMVDAVRNATLHSHGSRTVTPELVASTPPFNKPGTFRNSDGSWDAIVVAYTFGFLPREDLVVPQDVKVHFKVASLDVVHGFTIPGRTNVNLEVLPGHVSEVTQTFHHAGRFLILCNEYCGSGHHFMTAHIRVLAKGEDPAHPPALTGAPDANASEAKTAIEKAQHTMSHDSMAGMQHGDDA